MTNRPQKRILSVQDFSCFGKCSSTVALPVISAFGHETVVLPTAVFSTHTGGFTGYHITDLTGDIRPITEHWKKEGITFDGAVVGYLCEGEQCAIVKDLLHSLRAAGTYIVVDPAMADHRKLYAGFTEKHVAEMRDVCREADVILPNMTEACLLLGIEQRESTEENAVEVLELFRKEGYPAAVLTGAERGGQVGAVGMDKDGKTTSFFAPREPISFHGTGDLYTSAYTGELFRSGDAGRALSLAVTFTADAIHRTQPYADMYPYGVMFEQSLPLLMK